MEYWHIAAALIALFVLRVLIRKYVFLKGFRKRYVLVTGCDMGLGFITALLLEEKGFNVFAGCLTEKGMNALKAKRKSERLRPVLMDVTNSKQVLAAKEIIAKELPEGTGLWGLVNNAGVLGAPVSLFATPRDYESVMDINLVGAVRVTNAFLPLLSLGKGRIVNITSIMGRLSMWCSPYTVSKFAIRAYSETISHALHEFGVSMHMIEPGFHQTGLNNFKLVNAAVERSWNNLPDSDKEFFTEQYKRKMAAMANFTAIVPYIAFLNKVENVAGAVYHALGSRYPSYRYPVGMDAVLFLIPMSMMPDFIQNWYGYLSYKLVPPLMLIAEETIGIIRDMVMRSTDPEEEEERIRECGGITYD